MASKAMASLLRVSIVSKKEAGSGVKVCDR